MTTSGKPPSIPIPGKEIPAPAERPNKRPRIPYNSGQPGERPPIRNRAALPGWRPPPGGAPAQHATARIPAIFSKYAHTTPAGLRRPPDHERLSTNPAAATGRPFIRQGATPIATNPPLQFAASPVNPAVPTVIMNLRRTTKPGKEEK